jgi:hypothetical protein
VLPRLSCGKRIWGPSDLCINCMLIIGFLIVLPILVLMFLICVLLFNRHSIQLFYVLIYMNLILND